MEEALQAWCNCSPAPTPTVDQLSPYTSGSAT